jgi:hypothetical protein
LARNWCCCSSSYLHHSRRLLPLILKGTNRVGDFCCLWWTLVVRRFSLVPSRFLSAWGFFFRVIFVRVI